MPYAKNELDNCVSDCLRISQLAGNLCLAGDLNTSFDEKETHFEIKNIKSREVLVELCRECNFDLTTMNIFDDHIHSREIHDENDYQAKIVEKGIKRSHGYSGRNILTIHLFPIVQSKSHQLLFRISMLLLTTYFV